MKNQKKKTAFSLVELSIVILMIGLVIAAIAKGSALLAYNRLINARSITNSSPVQSIPDLGLWYDATAENAFLESELQSSTRLIGTWIDTNPLTQFRNNATQSTNDRKPKYYTNCINSLPCVTFDCNGLKTSCPNTVNDPDFLNFDGSFLVGTDFTIFIVAQRRSTRANYIFAGSGSGGSGDRLTIGYSSNTQMVFSNSDGTNITMGLTIAGYTDPPIPEILVFRLESSANAISNLGSSGISKTGKLYYKNGSLLYSSQPASVTETNLVSYDGARLGGSGWGINGDIGEIIIFKRALTNEERLAIERYLGKKWKITTA